MLLSVAAREYLAEGALRQKTIQTLQNDALHTESMLAHFGDIQVSDPAKFNLQTIRGYLSYHQGRGVSESTYATYFKHLKSFVRWLHREELIEENWTARIPPPKIPELLPKVLTDDQIERLFIVLRRDRSKIGFRNLVIFTTFLDTGLRCNELANLKVDDVQVDQRFVFVKQGKGKKQRVVPFGLRLKKLLLRYASDHRYELSERAGHVKSEYFFLNQEGKRFKAAGIQKMCRRNLQMIGVNYATHVLRHTFATLYLRNGGDIESLRLILGHATLEMTKHYLHLLPADLIKSHNTFSPMDKLE